MDFKDYLMDFLMDYGAMIYPIVLLGMIVLYNRLTSQKAPEQYGFRQGVAPSVEKSAKAQAEGEQVKPNSPITATTDDEEEYEDDDEVKELDYESDDFERGFGIQHEDDECEDEITEVGDEQYPDPEEDPERYDAYINSKKTQEKETAKEDKAANQPNQPRKPETDTIDPIIIMYLTPQTGQNFKGYELLQALSNYGVYLSEKKHFQRFADDDGSGELWFHVASMTHPGTFEMDEPGKLTCNGLVFILETDKVRQLGQAYETMLETASALAGDLQGQLLNDKQAPLDENVIRKNKYYIAKHQVAETMA
ncbi:MAG: hypothetical protein CMF43_00820 [Legionellales bacterium]|nr:hypothetical protein [Legionellales bacterium]